MKETVQPTHFAFAYNGWGDREILMKGDWNEVAEYQHAHPTIIGPNGREWYVTTGIIN